MIITLTCNPSIDRTVTLPGALTPGAVHRIASSTTAAAGKGINVALGVHRAGLPVRALLPAHPEDPFFELLAPTGLPVAACAADGPIRTNLTVIADGITTKINEPGAGAPLTAIQDLLLESLDQDDVLMLSGSLPATLPNEAYADFIALAHQRGAWVGLDASEEPLAAVADAIADGKPAPHFMKPNAHELGQITGMDGNELEARAATGDVGAVLEAAEQLRERGVTDVLVTLGGSGALLACPDGAFTAAMPPITAASTVGAGDSATAGYLISMSQGEPAERRLVRAVAYGTAAAAMPGTSIPTPGQVRPDLARITQIS